MKEQPVGERALWRKGYMQGTRDTLERVKGLIKDSMIDLEAEGNVVKRILAEGTTGEDMAQAHNKALTDLLSDLLKEK